VNVADPGMASAARSEVHALHEFFTRWFRGEIAEASGIERVTAALSAEFRMVPPSGLALGREDVLAGLRRARASRPADFTIVIAGAEVIWSDADHALVVYVEHQTAAGGMSERRSSAFFIRQPAAPNGVQWRHLQETWMSPVADNKQVSI
jgi:hypothetical protein